MDENLKQSIHQWASSIHFRIRIYFYGSCLKGTANQDSDLDLAIEFLDPWSNRTLIWMDYHDEWEYRLCKYPHPQGAALTKPPVGGQIILPCIGYCSSNTIAASVSCRHRGGCQMFLICTRIQPFGHFPSGTGLASPHDPTHRVGVSISI